jgi:hypothetical protein
MKTLIAIAKLCFVVVLASAVSDVFAAEPPGEDVTGKKVTVEASIDHASGDPYIFAERRTGDFTVPPGYRAVNFKYHWGDPTSGRESTHLSPKNIDPVRGWVPSDIGAPGVSLGPGTYRFGVGGMPGAMGTLSFMLVKGDDPRVGTTETKRTIDVETWSHEYPEWKSKATYVLEENGLVTGTMDEIIDYPSFAKSEHWTIEAARQTGKFNGTATGNVITGTWSLVIHPHTMRWHGDGTTPAYSCVHQTRYTMQMRVVLYADGTLSETGRGTGTTESQWSSTAPESVAGKHESWPFDFAFPGKDIKQPITGLWKDRNASTVPPSPEK